MNRKILIVTAAAVSILYPSAAQKVLTLRDCYDKAALTNAIAGEKEAYTSIWEIKDKNLSKSWFPSIDASGSIIYNSSVIDMADVLGKIPVPGIVDLINPMPHEQYRVAIDINQVIFDGGAIKGARALEKADLNINEKQTETDLYKLRDQINGYYFTCLLLDRQKELLESYLDLITKRLTAMQSALESGVILRSDIDVLTSEKIGLVQHLNENKIRKASLLKILSGLTGLVIDETTEFVLPTPEGEQSAELLRPELQIYDLRREQLEASRQVVRSKRMPKAAGFVTLGYGNPPGNNFFRNEFAPYYILGASLKWNILDWNKSKNEKHFISLQQNIIDNRKRDLADNLKRLLEVKNAEISNLRSLLLSDSELIELRKRITAAAESKYDNGTITATDYMNEMTAERQALINHEIHKINLSKAMIEYLNISGKEIE